MNAEERLLNAIFDTRTLQEIAEEAERDAEQEEYDRFVVEERTRQYLSVAPKLAALMLDRAVAGATLNVTAVQDADDLYGLLVRWATDFGRYLKNLPGIVALYADADRDAVRLPHLRSTAFKVGLVAEVAGWLRSHEAGISAVPGSAVFESDLDENMRTWLARWPLEIVNPTLPRACPVCGRYAVRVAWADREGAYDEYRAECGACGSIVRQTPAFHELRDLETLLSDFRDGDEVGWDAEFDFLEAEHRERLDELEALVRAEGMRDPILLGDDGRVRDGHHRLAVARRLGLQVVPVTTNDQNGRKP
jgi:hypothetical protein